MNIPTTIIEKIKDLHGFGDWNIQLGFEQRFRCIYCDGDLLATYDAYNSWQWDHVVPGSKGGKDTLENIAICCKACNYLKRDYIPSGSTREEQIDDARRYVLKKRKNEEIKLAALRDLVRGADSVGQAKGLIEPAPGSITPVPEQEARWP